MHACMHTYRFRPFFQSAWNVFDLLIVIFSIFETIYVDLHLAPRCY